MQLPSVKLFSLFRYILPLMLLFTLGCQKPAVQTEDQSKNTKVDATDDSKKDSTAASQKENEAGKTVENASADAMVSLAEGRLQFPSPKSWERVQPRNNIVEAEFAVAAAEGDKRPGRVTLMASAGGIDANVARWEKQFLNADGKGNPKANVEKKTVGGLTVHFVSLQGIYLDKPAPFVPKAIKRPGHKMLAAIVETDGAGTYFVKFYGPEKTVSANADAFNKMIENWKWK